MSVYYNENDPKAAAWLRELMFEGQIAWGDVDERSIEDVRPSELAGYSQCHFFAGIGGWSYALRLAGWPDDRPVWTGSCPCQPFSAAGKGKGFADERHLWPAWFHLLTQCQPTVVFGEQVASPAGLGWFDLVSADLEATNYAVGAVDTCAASVGAPHIRQRLYWVAHHHHHLGREQHAQRDSGALQPGQQAPQRDYAGGCSELGDTSGEGLEKQQRERETPRDETRANPWKAAERAGAPARVWCRDGKWRPVEPGTFPLAHGVANRVGLLRGYGNAIVPQVAAAFIEASGLI